jgi:hypothetical protein
MVGTDFMVAVHTDDEYRAEVRVGPQWQFLQDMILLVTASLLIPPQTGCAYVHAEHPKKPALYC